MSATANEGPETQALFGRLSTLGLNVTGTLRSHVLVALAHQSSGLDEQCRWLHSCVFETGKSHLKLFLAEISWKKCSTLSASELSGILNGKTRLLERAEATLHLDSCVIWPADLQRMPAPSRHRQISDAHYRLLGAVVLSTDRAAARQFFSAAYYEAQAILAPTVSAKTMLQEYAQGTMRVRPFYSTVATSGPDHDKTFFVRVTVGNRTADGMAPSKSKAEELASEKWLSTHAAAYVATRRSPRAPRAPGSQNVSTEVMNSIRTLGLDPAAAPIFQRAITHPSRRQIDSTLAGFDDYRVSALIGDLVIRAAFSLKWWEVGRCPDGQRPKSDDYSIVLAGAEDTKALAHVGDDWRLWDHLRLGPNERIENLSDDTRASFVKAIIGARSIANHTETLLALVGREVRSRFSYVIDRSLRNESLRSPLTRLNELLGLQQIRMVSSDCLRKGPSHRPEITGRLRLKSDVTQSILDLVGGTGPNGTEARHQLAARSIGLLGALHRDLSEMKRVLPNETYARLVDFFLPSALFATPSNPKAAQKWAGVGLLCTRALTSGNYEAFRRWTVEVEREMARLGHEQASWEPKLLSFYRSLVSQEGWSLSQIAQRAVSEASAFAGSDASVDSAHALDREGFFPAVSSILKVLGVSAKPRESSTTLRATVDALHLLWRGQIEMSVEGAGADTPIKERDGSTLLLLSHVLESIPGKPPEEIHFSCGVDANALLTVEVRFPSQVQISREWISAFTTSIVGTYLAGEGLFRSANLNNKHLELELACDPFSDLYGRARHAIECSPTSLDEETRAILGSLLHDLKNELLAARIISGRLPTSRTDRLEAQSQISRHFDAIRRLADQFQVLSGALDSPIIERFSFREFFNRLSARTLANAPTRVAVRISGSDEEASISSAPVFLDSILSNLVKNGVEAMENGGRLDLAWGASPDDSTLVVTVSDTGPGMDPERLTAILSGISVRSTKRAGSGIGMLTAVAMARRLGCELGGKSELGVGTTWTLTIPRLDNGDSEYDPSIAIELATAE